MRRKICRVLFLVVLLLLIVLHLSIVFYGVGTHAPPSPSATGTIQETSPHKVYELPKIIKKPVLREEYRDDPEGPAFAEIQQLLLTVNLQSMLDVGSSISGHMCQFFGDMFDHVVVVGTEPNVLESLKGKLAHPHAKFVLSDMATFAKTSGDKFDVIFFNMVLQSLPTYEVAPMMRTVEALLEDEGIGIFLTTHVEEGRGGFYLSTGALATEEEFNAIATTTPTIHRVRRWTKSGLLQELESKLWEVTSHVVFTYYRTEQYARRVWEQSERLVNRSFQDVWRVPLAQMAAVRRLVIPYNVKFAAPVKPSSAAVKNVIFSLVRGGSERSDYEELIRSRQCLRAALYGKTKVDQVSTDEVFFSEGNVPEHIRLNILEQLPGSRFVDIRSYGAFGGIGNGSGGGIYRWKPWVRFRRPGEYPVGYRHMCRFMTLLWMHVLREYEYAARVDDDVCIHSMINPFQFLRESRADYGYALVTKERHRETIGTLTPWLHMYIRNRSIRPRQALAVGNMYFTNFFVANVSWWLLDSVRIFMDTVDRTGNIYTHRWGDAPLQTAALHMLAEPNRVQWVRVDYTHLSTSNEIRNGFEVPQLALTTSTTSILRNIMGTGMKSAISYMSDWYFYAAPCLVADHFKLKGSPFKNHSLAVRALQNALTPHVMMYSKDQGIDLNQYPPGELAYMVQIDLYGSSFPLPSENIGGASRKNAMVRLLSGKDRMNPEYKDFTFVEWMCLVASPCYGIGFLKKMHIRVPKSCHGQTGA